MLAPIDVGTSVLDVKIEPERRRKTETGEVNRRAKRVKMN
jgi:hypothetical protein